MQVVREGLDMVILPLVHRRTLVWIHGYGDTAELFCDDFFKEPLIEDCKVVLPTAGLMTVEGSEPMHSWYKILGNFQVDESIEPSVHRINSILLEESKHTDCLMIGGFSQGAVMSLYCGLNIFAGHISAIIALSGFALPMEISDTKKATPVLMYHGALDNRIPLSVAIDSANNNLTGVNYHLEVHPTMPHEVYLEEYEYIRSWLKAKLNI